MVVIVAARVALSVLKIGPQLLRLKPLFFAARLGPKGKIIGGIIQGFIIGEAITVSANLTFQALDFQPRLLIANQIIKTTGQNPIRAISSADVQNVDELGNLTIKGIQSLGPQNPNRFHITKGRVERFGLIAGAFSTPFVGRQLLENVAVKSGVPQFLFLFI